MKSHIFSFKKIVTNGGVMYVLAQILANFLNFIFNAYLGRELSFEDYGLVTFITSLLYLAIVVINAIATTVNHRVAFLNGQSGKVAGYKFYFFVQQKALLFSIGVAFLWLLLTPLLMKFFNIAEPLPILAFIPVLFFATLAAVSKGFLLGNFLFAFVGVITVFEALSKLFLPF